MMGIIVSVTATFASPVRAAALVLVAGLGALSAAHADIWSRWRDNDQAAILVADHSVWDQILQTYVRPGPNGAMCLDYSAVRAPDHAAIDAYIHYLGAFPISRVRRDEQLAFWINLYNALTVQVVLKHYPVATIRDIDISPGWFANGPWGAKLVTVERHKLSLDDIEDRILRPLWPDPRVHYALNCASAGCPDLAPRAYTGADVERQLDSAARAFVNHPRGVQVSAGRARLSGLYKWYRDDFGGDDGTVLAHLRRYASPGLLDLLRGVKDVRGYDYDWSLNDCRAKFL